MDLNDFEGGDDDDGDGVLSIDDAIIADKFRELVATRCLEASRPPHALTRELADSIAMAIVGRPRELQKRDSVPLMTIYRFVLEECNQIAFYQSGDSLPDLGNLQLLAKQLDVVLDETDESGRAESHRRDEASAFESGADGPDVPSGKTYLTKDLCRDLDNISSPTLTKYVELAGIRRTRKGERDRRFSDTERLRILHAAERYGPENVATAARQILKQIESKSKDQN